MGMWRRRVWGTILGGAAWAALVGTAILTGPARAATYSGSFTVDPTSLQCGYFGSVENCEAYTFISPITLQVGDTVTETVDYTSRVTIPGSDTASFASIGLFNQNAAAGPAITGLDDAAVSSEPAGYIGSSLPPITAYESPPTLDGYAASIGFCCGYGLPTPGFSITGMTSTFTIQVADPLPMIGVVYSVQATLPATPKVLEDIDGGTLDHPTILPAGEGVGQITSDVGGAAGSSQFYSFLWNGGLMETKGIVSATDPSSSFEFALYWDNRGTLTFVTEESLSSANDFMDTIEEGLDRGCYEIGIVADGPGDPPFTITFDTPVGFAAIPEPSAWALMAAGAFGCGGHCGLRGAIKVGSRGQPSPEAAAATDRRRGDFRTGAKRRCSALTPSSRTPRRKTRRRESSF